MEQKLTIVTTEQHKNSTTHISTTQAKEITLHKEHLKIREYKPENFKELENGLLVLANVIGVKIAPSKEQIAMIVRVVKTGFGDFSIQEIGYAFELALAKVIEVDTKHFQSFTPDYVSSVCVAYRRHKNKKLAEAERIRKEIEIRELTKVLTPEEIQERQRQNYEALKVYFDKNSSLPISWAWSDVFHHMEKAGLIKMTNDEKAMFAVVVADKIERENSQRKDLKPTDLKNLIQRELTGEEFKSRCREEIVKNHFQ